MITLTFTNNSNKKIISDVQSDISFEKKYSRVKPERIFFFLDQTRKVLKSWDCGCLQ